MFKKTLALTAIAASLAAFAPSGEAEAGKRFGVRIGGGHHHHFHHRNFHHKFVVHTGPSCGFYFKKWKFTGSSFWKAKYFACIS